MKYIDENKIAEILKWEDLIPVMRKTMIDFSQGRVKQPVRRLFETGIKGGFFGSMPAACENALGAKLLTFYPNNVQQNLATHTAVIVLFNPETGGPQVMMDGRLITEMRTAAVTTAFIDAVAQENIDTLAVLGAGVQAKSHIQALLHVRPFKEIIVWNRTPKKAEQLADAFDGQVMSAQEAVNCSDVVVTATSSKEPVLKGEWLKPGTKVASVGWSGPDNGELDEQTLSNPVIVDSRKGAQTESGNIRRFNTRIYAELGQVLDGSVPVDKNETIVFDSIGMACQDIATAKLIYDKLSD